MKIGCIFVGWETEDYLAQSLRPWIVRAEYAFFKLLPQSRYVRLDSDALLKTDLKTRTEIYAQQRKIGLRTLDSR